MTLYNGQSPVETVEEQERVRELRYLIKGLEHAIQATYHDLDTQGNNRYEGRLARLDKTIDTLLKQRRTMVERHERGWELIAQYKTRVAELKNKLVAQQNNNDLVRLMKLVVAMNAMQKELDPQILAANLANDEGDE